MASVFVAFDRPDELLCFYYNFGELSYQIQKNITSFNNENDVLHCHTEMVGDVRIRIYKKDDDYNFEDVILKYIKNKKENSSISHIHNLIYILKDGRWYTCSSTSPMFFKLLEG